MYLKNIKPELILISKDERSSILWSSFDDFITAILIFLFMSEVTEKKHQKN